MLPKHCSGFADIAADRFELGAALAATELQNRER